MSLKCVRLQHAPFFFLSFLVERSIHTLHVDERTDAGPKKTENISDTVGALRACGEVRRKKRMERETGGETEDSF